MSGTASKQMSREQSRELAAAVVRQLPDDLTSSVAQHWIEDQASLQRVLRIALEPLVIRPMFHRDMTKEGYKLIEAGPSLPEGTQVGDLDFVSFHNSGESSVSGKTLQARAKDMDANLGQAHAEYLLEHQSEIPAEYRRNYLVFPATIWRGRDGSLDVPFLDWFGGRWFLDFFWLDSDWDSYARLVRFRKSR